MEFDWSERNVGDWRNLLAEAPRANHLQSWPFAKAVRALDHRPTRLATIVFEGETVGMMAVQVLKLGPVKIVNLHRGPIWFELEPPEQWLREFTNAFNKEFPKGLFRKRTWMPEWHDDEKAHEILNSSGFKLNEKRNYQTIWVDLQRTEEEIRAGFKRNWRNKLGKSERAEFSIKEDWSGVTHKHFLQHYNMHKATVGYRGPSSKFLQQEILAAVPFKDALLLWATKDRQPLAGILVFVHGNSATYHAGWSNQGGRSCHAHNRMLWHIIKILKKKGITQLDLGWIEPENATGLTKFKQGLGGKEFKLVGVFS